MANFDSSIARINSAYAASNLLQLLRAVYHNGKSVQELLARYVANTDPVFTGAVNALFTASERQELNAMAQDINSLVTAWENNHAGALSS
jgi:hypothetical protein